jgi:hypothetical protein
VGYTPSGLHQPWATEELLRCPAGSFDTPRAAPHVLHANILLESQLAAIAVTDPYAAAFVHKVVIYTAT